MSAVSGEVPRTERLFLDPREVRGFMPGELGPLDGWGMPAGGTMKVTGRAELELPLIRKAGISAVGFLDAGGVLERGLGASGMSYGVGFVWRSPIGPLRFDWAWRPDGGPPVFGFGIGL
jgi:translocation and assembly module TamA